jgi:hypothetical protein
MISNLINTAFQATVVSCAVMYFFPDSKEVARKYVVKAAKEIVKRFDDKDD